MLLNFKQIHRLSTKEDEHFFHLHKIFGIICMVHFIYRVYEGLSKGYLDFSDFQSTNIWLFFHAFLHITSFQFVLPQKRNHVYNIIWPEMRLHTMIFAYRSIVTMFLINLFNHKWLTLNQLNVSKGFVVIGTILLADFVTFYFKESGIVEKTDSTMRKNPYPTWVWHAYTKYHNYFYSFSQILSTMNILTYNDMGRIFFILIPIQTAPFCMTLVKKGIMNQFGWHFYYTITLLINFIYGILENGPRIIPAGVYWYLVLVFCSLRFGLNVNKYILWSAIIVVQISFALQLHLLSSLENR
jgi:hypothetical protein